MIAKFLVDDVRRLLADGHLSQRKIAEKLGLSRGSVNAIATGKRRDSYSCRSKEPQNARFEPPTGSPARCPGCGGLTQMPCLACYIRSQCAAKTPPPQGLSRRPSRGTSPIASCG
jgi:hypothetical protein